MFRGIPALQASGCQLRVQCQLLIASPHRLSLPCRTNTRSAGCLFGISCTRQTVLMAQQVRCAGGSAHLCTACPAHMLAPCLMRAACIGPGGPIKRTKPASVCPCPAAVHAGAYGAAAAPGGAGRAGDADVLMEDAEELVKELNSQRQQGGLLQVGGASAAAGCAQGAMRPASASQARPTALWPAPLPADDGRMPACDLKRVLGQQTLPRCNATLPRPAQAPERQAPLEDFPELTEAGAEPMEYELTQAVGVALAAGGGRLKLCTQARACAWGQSQPRAAAQPAPLRPPCPCRRFLAQLWIVSSLPACLPAVPVGRGCARVRGGGHKRADEPPGRGGARVRWVCGRCAGGQLGCRWGGRAGELGRRGCGVGEACTLYFALLRPASKMGLCAALHASQRLPSPLRLQEGRPASCGGGAGGALGGALVRRSLGGCLGSVGVRGVVQCCCADLSTASKQGVHTVYGAHSPAPGPPPAASWTS